jgi:phosphoribosylcarboxyaminoimidazole (NCAIR) mutase
MIRDPNMPRYIPVKGTKYVKDTHTGALLNTDISEVQNYKLRKQIREKENEEKRAMKDKIENLENDISDIKDMLIQLLNSGKKDAN